MNKIIHRKEVTMKNQETNILAIIYMGGGSTWLEGTDETDTAIECAKMCKMDWKHLFKFKKKQRFAVNIFDISKLDTEGWYADAHGVWVSKTKEQIPHKKTIWVIV